MAETEEKSPCNFSDSGFFSLRTPALPLAELLGWSEGLSASTLCATNAQSQVIENAWRAEVHMLRDRLREISRRPEIVHALFVASPALECGVEHWLRDPDSKKGMQAQRALVRYFTRICARATPFGLFSGCSLGRIIPDWSGGAILRLLSRRQYQITSHLDFDYLCALAETLCRDPVIAANLVYRPNSSLHRFADTWRYVATKQTGSSWKRHTMEVNHGSYLEAVLKNARTGAKVPKLLKVLVEIVGLEEEKARGYLQDLIGRRVLVPDLDPCITGESFVDEMIARLEQLPSSDGIAELLRSARDRLASLDRQGMGVAPEEYRLIASGLQGLPVQPALSTVFQTEMIKPAEEAVLSAPVVNELKWSVEVLRRLGQRDEPEALRSLRTAFIRRYDRAIVPLLEALDTEAGIGFGNFEDPSPLIGELGLDNQVPRSGMALNSLLLQKVVDCERRGEPELTLEAADLPPLTSSSPALPDSFAVMATLIARSAEALRDGDFQLKIGGVWGPDGARYLARFCHVDPELKRNVLEHLKQEEACCPEAVYAEIVHLTRDGMGKVLIRPVLREYELVYLGRSGAAPDRQLPAGDLLLCVERGQFILYSQRLGRRIIPRLTSAHGYMNPGLDPVYRFLCLLQRQGGTRIGGFSWGALGALEFLPRVRIGRLILAPAQWRLGPAEVHLLTRHEGGRRFVDMQELRQRRNLPRWIVLEESDQALPVDLDNPLSVDAFIHVINRQPHAVLREMLPSPADLCVTGPEGSYCHELQVPFVRHHDAICAGEPAMSVAPDEAKSFIEEGSSTRTLPLGSEWIFVKLYGGHTSLDKLLTRDLSPFIHTALCSGVVARWFFLRFSDPDQHLRIRFQGQPDRLSQELLPLLNSVLNPLLAAGKIWKIQFDTYEREIERYGGTEGIVSAEEIFFHDSQAVLEILEQLDRNNNPNLRWQIALLGCDMLLSDLGFGLKDKRSMMEGLRNKYGVEFRVSGDRRRLLADSFRAKRALLDGLLCVPHTQDPTLALARQTFQTRSDRIGAAIQDLQRLAESGRLLTAVAEIAASMIHMHINRLMQSSPREHECVLYDFLYRIYDGRLARIHDNGKSA